MYSSLKVNENTSLKDCIYNYALTKYSLTRSRGIETYKMLDGLSKEIHDVILKKMKLTRENYESSREWYKVALKVEKLIQKFMDCENE